MTDERSSGPLKTWQEVEAGERAYLFREEDDPVEGGSSVESPRRLTGLAISGGGIRSAAFGTGLLQALVAKRVLSRIDYLSTVSGGGFIGSCLSYFLATGNPDGTPAGTDPANFPLGRAKAGEEAGGGEENRVLDFLRQHGNYLIPGAGLNLSALVAVVLRAMVVSLFVYFGIVCVVVGVLHVGGLFGARNAQPVAGSIVATAGGSGADGAASPLWLGPRLQEFVSLFDNPLLAASALAVIAFAVLSVLYGLVATFRRTSLFWVAIASLLGASAENVKVGIRWATRPMSKRLRSTGEEIDDERAKGFDDRGARYQLRTSTQKGFGVLLDMAIVLFVLGMVPVAYDYLAAKLGFEARGMGGAAASSAAVGSILGYIQMKMQQDESAASTKLSSLRIAGGAGLLLFGILVGSFAVAEHFAEDESFLTGLLSLGGAALFVGLATNLNSLGLHRMYRDRLMETFMPNHDNVISGRWGRATRADDLLIEQICCDPNRRPYHIVNTNVVLVDSENAKYRARGGDNFILSRLFCGSAATRWRDSTTYLKGRGRGMTLATAMAVSGAAANPNTGVAGRGAMRSRPVSMLLSLLSIRLGYWAPSPRVGSLVTWPNFITPGLRAVFGRGLHERRRLVELTDGGHFENLGLYELIRRRIDLIVVSDGGCDPDFHFGDLANAVERVRVDFGVTIEFDTELGLAGLLPGSAAPATAASTAARKIQTAARGFAKAKILYPADESRGLGVTEGTLYYVKTTWIAGLPADLYGYKLAHAGFPDETTADQFFDESQFEAYRELGYRIGRQLLESTSWNQAHPAQGSPHATASGVAERAPTSGPHS